MDEIAQIWKGAGGVAHMTFVPGSGAGWAEAQISAPVLLSVLSLVATNLTAVNGADVASLTLQNNFHDAVDEAALALSYVTRHPTSGDDSGLLIQQSIASAAGQTRWIDIQARNGTVGPFARELDIRPIAGLPGGDVHSAGYLQLSAGIALLGRAPAFSFDGGPTGFTVASLVGARITPGGTTVLEATQSVTEFDITHETSGTAVLAAKMSIVAQSTTAAASTGGDLELGPGTGTAANGNLSIVNLATAASASAGGAAALPATPSEYLVIKVNGTTVKVPAYAP
jgi:hypothetical protein